MSTRWDQQTRSWWNQLSQHERIDICENILFPAVPGEADGFRLLLHGSLVRNFFRFQNSAAWDVLCESFKQNPNDVLDKMTRWR